MSTEYDDKIVRMQFDNKQFESGVRTTIASLDELKASLKFDGVTTGIDNLASKVKNVSFENMAQGIEQITVKIPVMGTILDQTIRNMTNSVTSFVKTTLDKFSTLGNMKSGFGEYELQINSVRTIMAATGASVETVNKYLEELNEYADQTIYSFSDMTKNIGSFTNAGVELDKAVAAIKGVSNLAAVSGANAQQASHAMINFAQSLSQGYMGLVDWGSIRTAQMDTMEFKNELLKTAEALGTVKRQGDMYVSTTTNAAGKTSEAFNASKNFRETLQNQWLTTDVLITTLNRYNDTTTVIGQKATKAATEVNTLSQALDTIVEDLGSSWSTSWRYIIGDIEQATTVWTKFADAVKGILGPSNDARNEMLKFWATGKSGAEETIELTEEETKKYQALYDVAHQGVMGDWGNGAERIERLTAAGYDYAEVQGIINKMVDGSVKSVEDLAVAMKKEQDVESDQMTGREMFIKGLSNLWKAITKFTGAIAAAWRDVFPKKNGNALVAMSEAFMKLTEKLIISDKTADEVRRTFRGLFSILGLVATVIKAVIKGIGALVMSLVSGTKKSNASIWTITATIGDLLTAFTAIVRESGILESLFVSAGKVIGTTGRSIINIIGSIVNALWNLIKAALGMKDVDFNLDLITNVFAVAAGSIAVFSDFIASKIEAFGFIPVTGIETFTANVKNAFGFFTQEGGPFVKAVGIFLAAWEKLKIGLQVVAAALAPVIDIIKKKLEQLIGGEINLANILDFLKKGGLILLLAELAMMIRNIRRVLGDIVGVGTATTKMFKAFTGVADAMTDRLKAMTTKIRAAALFQIALAIAVMVGAVYILSKMDRDALIKGLGSFTILMTELMAVLKKMNSKELVGSAGVLMSLGIAIFLLTASVKILASMPVDQAYMGLFLLKVLMTELTSTIKGMNELIGKNVTGFGNIAKVMLAIALSVLLLMPPLIILGLLPAKVVWQGLGFMELIFAEMVTVIAGMEAVAKINPGMGSLDGVAKTMIGIAFACILLMVPVLVLGMMPWDVALRGIAFVGALMLAMGVSIRLMEKAELPKGIIGTLLVMVAVIAIISIIVIAFSKVKTADLWMGIAAVAAIMVLMAAFTWFILWTLKKIDPSNVKDIVKILGLIIGMLATFIVIMLILKKLSIEQIVGIAAVIFVIGVALFLICAGLVLLIETISKMRDTSPLDHLTAVFLSFGLAVLSIGASIYLLVKAFETLNNMKISPNLMKNISVFAAFLLLMVQNLIGGIIGAIVMSGPAIVNGIFTIINLILENLDNNLGEMIEHIQSIIIQILEGILQIAGEVTNYVLDIILEILDAIAGDPGRIEQIVGDVIDIIVSVINGIAAKITDINDAIENLLIAIFDDLAFRTTKWGKAAWEAVKTLFRWIWKKLLQYVIEPAKVLGKKIIGGIVGFVIDGINALVNFIVEGIESAVNLIIEGINDLIPGSDWDLGTVNLNAPSIGMPGWVDEWRNATMPESAKGNVFNPNGTIVGEAGPELLSSKNGRSVITPLTNQYARSTTRDMMETYTRDISDQLASINDGINASNKNVNQTYDDSDILSKVDTMTNSINELKEDILNVRVMLDTGALVGQLAGPMDNQLGSINKLRVRAAGSIKR